MPLVGVEGKEVIVVRESLRKMHPKKKKRWARALRSGDYVQTENHRREIFSGLALRTKKNTFSACGVLCDLHRRSKPGRKWGTNGFGDWTYGKGRKNWYGYKERGAVAELPVEVRLWAWLNHHGGIYIFLPPDVNKEYLRYTRAKQPARFPKGWIVVPMATLMMTNCPFKMQADLIEEFM